MNREEQLKFCRICEHNKFDKQQGIICGITQSRATFEGTCHSFVEDSFLKAAQNAKEIKQQPFDDIASGGKRFANFIIDRIVLYLFSMLFGVILAFVSPSVLYLFETDNFMLNYLLGFIIAFIFYSSLEASSGRTVGKLITKTKVIDEYGNTPSYGKILLRTLCRFIPFDAFSFLGSTAEGWHDTLSNTRVVNA